MKEMITTLLICGGTSNNIHLIKIPGDRFGEDNKYLRKLALEKKEENHMKHGSKILNDPYT